MPRSSDLIELYKRTAAIAQQLTVLGEHLPQELAVHANAARKELEKTTPGLVSALGNAYLKEQTVDD